MGKIRKLINWMTFGRFCKPKYDRIFFYLNGKISELDLGNLHDSSRPNPSNPNAVMFETTITVQGSPFMEYPTFEDMQKTLNVLGIPLESDMEGEND